MMSDACLEEIIEVLNRRELRALLPGLTDESVKHLNAWLVDYAEFITPVPSAFKHDVDPKDEPYINLAIASGTAYLISWDKHMLSLRDIRSAQGAEFTKKYPNVFVLTPKELLDGFYAGLLPKPEQS